VIDSKRYTIVGNADSIADLLAAGEYNYIHSGITKYYASMPGLDSEEVLDQKLGFVDVNVIAAEAIIDMLQRPINFKTLLTLGALHPDIFYRVSPIVAFDTEIVAEKYISKPLDESIRFGEVFTPKVATEVSLRGTGIFYPCLYNKVHKDHITKSLGLIEKSNIDFRLDFLCAA